MQLADHDALFGPKKRFQWKRALTWIPLFPALLILLLPSFQIGLAVYKAPSFAMPELLKPHSLFTFPATDDVLMPMAAGKLMHLIEKPEPRYITATESEGHTDISFVYRNTGPRFSLENLVTRFDHPSTYIFLKRIKIEAPSTRMGSSEGVSPASEKRALASLDSDSIAEAPQLSELSVADKTLLSRRDGIAQVACWKAPEALPFVEAKALTIQLRRPNSPKLMTVGAAGPGEVVYTGPFAGANHTVLVYHGGGLFSRYYDLKDFKVKKHDKVKVGQVIGLMLASTKREPATVHWDAQLQETSINPQYLLEESSRLCDSK